MCLLTVGNAQQKCKMYAKFGSERYYKGCVTKDRFDERIVLTDIDNCLKFTVAQGSETCTRISATHDENGSNTLKWLKICSPVLGCGGELTLADTQAEGSCFGLSYINRNREGTGPFTLSNQDYSERVIFINGDGRLALNSNSCKEPIVLRFRWRGC